MNQWEQAIVERTEAALRQTERYRENEEWEVPPDENFQLSYILTKGDPADPETILAIAICDRKRPPRKLGSLYRPMIPPPRRARDREGRSRSLR